MLLSPSAEQEQFADAVRRTLRDAGGPATAREAETREGYYDRELWDRLNALGVSGLAVAGDDDDGSFEYVSMVAFELGRVVAPVPYLEASVLPARLLLAAADETLRNDLLSQLADGELLPAALSGLDGTSPCILQDRQIYGAAKLVRSAPSDRMLQLATNDDNTPVLCVVELAAARRVPRSSTGRIPLMDVYYDNVAVIDSVPILAPHRVLQEVHSVTAAWWAGAAKALVDMASAYAVERRQFDKPIGAFQAIQHRLADMAVDTEAARLIGFRACARAAAGRLTEREALEAWMIAGDGARRCAAGAHQIFGGYGFTLDFDIQLFSRRIRALQFWLTDPISVERRLAEILRLDAAAAP